MPQHGAGKLCYFDTKKPLNVGVVRDPQWGLMRADGGVVSVEQLLEKAWNEQIDPFTNVVRFTVMNVRRKLGEPQVIDTVQGVGYRLK